MINFWGFEWREHTQIALLNDGGEFFPRIKNAFQAAKQFILIEMYLFESGNLASEIIDLLTQACVRGVRVYVLLDGVGSRALKISDREKLKKPGVYLAIYNPISSDKKFRNLHRDHRKLIVIDDCKAFVGGAGITDDFDPRFAKEATWRDSMLEISGELALDCRQLFEKVWRHVTGHNIAFNHIKRELSDGFSARLTPSAGVGRQAIKSSVINRVRSAESMVWIATAYFFPSRKLRRDLKKAAERGVDVRLILPGENTDHPGVRRVGHHMYAQLLKKGVRIYEYQPRFLHLKAVLCDDWTSIGSCNLDRWNQKWNLEANVEVDDPRFGDLVYQTLRTDLKNCKEISYATWRLRPWYIRWFEAISYRIVLLIERFIGDG